MKKLVNVKRFMIAFAAVISLGVLNTGAVFAEEAGDDEVLESSAFDEKLYQALLSELGAEKITVKLAQETESLNLKGKSLESIEGIKNFVNLKSLDLSGNSLTSVAELSSLTSLESLDVGTNKITALPDLKALTKLNAAKANFKDNAIEYAQFKDNLADSLLKADNYWLFHQLYGQTLDKPYSTIEVPKGTQTTDYFYYTSEVIRDTNLDVEEVTGKYTYKDLKLDEDVMFRVFKVDAYWDDIPLHPVSLTMNISQFVLQEAPAGKQSVAEYQLLKVEGEEEYEKKVNYEGDEITLSVNSSGTYAVVCKNYLKDVDDGNGGNATPKETPKSGSSSSKEKPSLKESPKTGDNTKSPYMYMLLIVVSSVAFLERFTAEMKNRRRMSYL